MALFRLTARITRVFPTRLININIEKKIAKPVYIFLLNAHLHKEETEMVSDVIWFMKLNEKRCSFLTTKGNVVRFQQQNAALFV